MPIEHLACDLVLLALCGAALLLALLGKWRAAAGVLLRFLLGWGLVALYNLVFRKSGILFGQNPFTAAVTGLLGLPGVGLLFMLRRIFCL